MSTPMTTTMVCPIPGKPRADWTRQTAPTATVMTMAMAMTMLMENEVPIVVAHGEGRAEFRQGSKPEELYSTLRYIDHDGNATEIYPQNPNGSPEGLTGFTTADGRATIMMPHPERVFRTVQNSWHPDEWGEDAPWMRLFRNARAWVG